MKLKKTFILFLILAFLMPSSFLLAATSDKNAVPYSKAMTSDEMAVILGSGGGGSSQPVRLSGICFNPDQSSPMWHLGATYMDITARCANGQALPTYHCQNEYGAYSISGQLSEYYSMYGEGRFYMNQRIFLKSPLRVYMTEDGTPNGKKVESRKISIYTGY